MEARSTTPEPPRRGESDAADDRARPPAKAGAASTQVPRRRRVAPAPARANARVRKAARTRPAEPSARLRTDAHGSAPCPARRPSAPRVPRVRLLALLVA